MATKKKASKKPGESKSPVSIYRLKVTLQGLRPPIWRRLEVPGDFTLGDLHEILQIAMGWENSHLHQFVIGKTYYSARLFDLDDVHDEDDVRLDDVAKEKDMFRYEYDFGDSWEHRILIEKVLDPEPHARYPRCAAGKQAGPPEDVGGVWGYAELLEAIEDESHPRREEFLEWVDEDFDPEAFDAAAVNAELKLRFR